MKLCWVIKIAIQWSVTIHTLIKNRLMIVTSKISGLLYWDTDFGSCPMSRFGFGPGYVQNPNKRQLVSKQQSSWSYWWLWLCTKPPTFYKQRINFPSNITALPEHHCEKKKKFVPKQSRPWETLWRKASSLSRWSQEPTRESQTSYPGSKNTSSAVLPVRKNQSDRLRHRQQPALPVQNRCLHEDKNKKPLKWRGHWDWTQGTTRGTWV